jgi:hypothetical protein
MLVPGAGCTFSVHSVTWHTGYFKIITALGEEFVFEPTLPGDRLLRLNMIQNAPDIWIPLMARRQMF